jgi:phenylalanyl-tRNA synthetase beta chain
MEGALVIADAERPAALAGIIGGSPSAVTERTRHILLESARFHPPAIRHTRKRLNVSTESSYRFERGTDEAMADLASRRAAHLILSLAGGTLAYESDVRGKTASPVRLTVRPQRISRLLGIPLSTGDIKKSLERLGFVCKGAGAGLSVVPPAHRQDIREEADVAEEVVRLVGYDKIPEQRRTATQAPEPLSRERAMVQGVREVLTGLGFLEARNYGLVSREQAKKWQETESAVELDNPISLSGELLAPSLLVNLLVNLQANLRREIRNVRLFETARVFYRGKNQIQEHQSLAWVAAGDTHLDHWKFKPRPLEIWDAKSWVESLLAQGRIREARFEKTSVPDFLHPAESQSVVLDGRPAGFFGKIHPRRAEAWDLPPQVFLAELNLSALAAAPQEPTRFLGLPKHPAVYRDFSLIFPESVAWSGLELFLRSQSEWIERIELFDLFVGGNLAPGQRSLAFRITFRHPERTLTDAEVGKVQEKILSGLQSTFQAIQRQ